MAFKANTKVLNPIMRLHEERMGKKEFGGKKSDVLKAPKEMESMTEADGKKIAEEHGKAHHIEIEHEHEAGIHRVRSSHPDGHEHESEHETAGEAHNQAADLAGADENEEQGAGEPDEEEGEVGY